MLSLLAQGGMGELYRARAEGAGRDVALKVVRADLAQSPMFKAMFLEEGRIASLLHHPNLVRVDGFGEADGRFYLCMELVEGRNAAALVDHCRKTRDLLAPRFAVYIAEQVARGLHHAHRLEVDGQPLRLVHRDVSPGNILLSNQGAVKLTDFGVARIRREKSLTVAGMRKGTLRYMAPEQIQNLTDPRSDVFSLAAVLWELLVGRPLFEGTTDAQLADAVRNQPIAAPSEYAADVPPALDAVLLHALERHPRARFQTAQDFAEAIRSRPIPPPSTYAGNIPLALDAVVLKALDRNPRARYLGASQSQPVVPWNESAPAFNVREAAPDSPVRPTWHLPSFTKSGREA
ncbi:MAG TPA: serine/threonine-protein kinase, partial [Myxococcales bacterium]|nr:serine/threonine-protein kinase [Myxococcales bacterium]